MFCHILPTSKGVSTTYSRHAPSTHPPPARHPPSLAFRCQFRTPETQSRVASYPTLFSLDNVTPISLQHLSLPGIISINKHLFIYLFFLNCLSLPGPWEYTRSMRRPVSLFLITIVLGHVVGLLYICSEMNKWVNKWLSKFKVYYLSAKTRTLYIFKRQWKLEIFLKNRF